MPRAESNKFSLLLIDAVFPVIPQPMKTALIAILLASLTFTAVRSEPYSVLRKEFRTMGYTIFTPFRSDELPGGILLFSRKGGFFSRRVTEFSLSPWNETFNVPATTLHSTGEVPASNYSKTLTVNASLQGDLVQPIINGKLAASYASEFSVEWSGPLTRRYIPLKDLLTYKTQLKADVKRALSYYKENEQLNEVYLLIDVVVAPSVIIKFKSKPGFSAEFKADKIKQFLNVGATVKLESAKDGELKFKSPMSVAYKAIRFDDELLSGAVSALTEEDLEKRIVDVNEIAFLKDEEEQ